MSSPPSLSSYHPSPLLHPFSSTRYPFHISISNVTTLQGPALSVDEPFKAPSANSSDELFIFARARRSIESIGERGETRVIVNLEINWRATLFKGE